MLRPLAVSAVISLYLILVGCAAISPNSPELTLQVQSARYLNPDINGQASPLVVSIYQLQDPVAFSQANYMDLFNNSSGALGSALVDQQSFEIRPHRTMTVHQSLSTHTQFIGIVAAYRNIDQARWRTVIPRNTPNSITLQLFLESQGLNATVRHKVSP